MRRPTRLKSRKAARVALEVNGAPIELNPFVRKFIRTTVTGMVRSLRGVKTVKSLNLRLENPGRNR